MNISVAKETALKIISFIKDGMSESDAVVLSDMSDLEYIELRKKFPKVAAIIDKAKIEYKYVIISKMNSLARNGDVKAINWVAENSNSFGNDFGKKKGDLNQPNPLKEAFRFIQDNSRTPVKPKTK